MPRRNLDGADGLDGLDGLGGFEGLDGLGDLGGLDERTVETPQNESSLPGRRPCRYEPPCRHNFAAHVGKQTNFYSERSFV